MAVSENDVRKIADLARLSLDDDRVRAMAADLNSILGHMDILRDIDTSGANPVVGIGSDGAPLRSDAVDPIPMRSTAQMLTAESRDGFILVPRLATHEDSAS